MNVTHPTHTAASCLTSALWLVMVHVSKPTCQFNPTVEYGAFNCTGMAVGSSCDGVCNFGYALQQNPNSPDVIPVLRATCEPSGDHTIVGNCIPAGERHTLNFELRARVVHIQANK
jgi:hypothetical protein